MLVFREGLECILVLAAITATMGASSDDYRGPVAFGAGAAYIATLVTWWIAIGLIDDLTQKVSTTYSSYARRRIRSGKVLYRVIGCNEVRVVAT